MEIEPKTLVPPFPVYIIPTGLEDTWEENRHKFRKGRFEFMGGPTMFIQGNNSLDGLEDNQRECQITALSLRRDEYINELQLDIEEQ
jgi:hypothetical protein